MVQKDFFSSLGINKMAGTLNKRLQVLRHRTARWFLPRPGRQATYDHRAREPGSALEHRGEESREQPKVKRLRPLN